MPNLLTRGVGLFYFSMENKTSIVSGIVLMVLAVAGFVFGRGKKGVAKAVVFAMASLCFLSGFYLFVGGLTKPARKQVNVAVEGQYVFQSPEDFRQKLEKYQIRKRETQDKTVRRLEFVCGDESESFTVYLTGLGSWNVPEQEVACRDGSKLLSYLK